MRKGPSLKAQRLKLLQRGDQVKVIAKEDKWLKILYKGQVGYILHSERFINILTPKTPSSENGSKIAQLKTKTKKINAEIAKFESDLKTFSQIEPVILNTLNEIDLTLHRTRKQITDIQAEIQALDRKIDLTGQEFESLKQQIDERETYAARRLVVLYKLSWLGKLNLLASAESMYEIVQRRNVIERILQQDEKMLVRLTADKAQLSMLLDSLNDQKQRKLSLEADLRSQMEASTHEKKKRAHVLQMIRSQASLEKATIGALKAAATDLNQAIQHFSRQAAALKPPVAKIEQPRPLLPAKPFHAFKGLLQLPVRGKIVAYFGRFVDPKYKIVNFRSGIDIQAEKGDPVHAVHGGRIIYADWFKGYGNMIIIDHGHSYYTVYAHTEELFKNKGDLVDTGEVIATVGETGSLSGVKLHFELRHHGTPVNPLDWIKKG